MENYLLEELEILGRYVKHEKNKLIVALCDYISIEQDGIDIINNYNGTFRDHKGRIIKYYEVRNAVEYFLESKGK